MASRGQPVTTRRKRDFPTTFPRAAVPDPARVALRSWTNRAQAMLGMASQGQASPGTFPRAALLGQPGRHPAEAPIGGEAQRIYVPVIPILETLWQRYLGRATLPEPSRAQRYLGRPCAPARSVTLGQRGARRSTLSQCRSRAPLATFRSGGSSCTQEPRDSDKKNNVVFQKR